MWLAKLSLRIIMWWKHVFKCRGQYSGQIMDGQWDGKANSNVGVALTIFSHLGGMSPICPLVPVNAQLPLTSDSRRYKSPH